MMRRDVTPDPELGAVLRRFDAPDPTADEQRRALKRRIEAAAAPLLAERRNGAWWEFAAVWARTLVPIGLATAVAAAAFIAWTARAGAGRGALTPVPAQDSLVGSVRRDPTSQHLLDAVVAPVLPHRN
ncbi:MAG: hypothetical protein KGL38_11300 [Gemmatimonadota bacterium]|nr:hypothetical protein [Gemmatimonadota bacterium]MDE3128584.1 hypothetical protein [Gemmatimonadota bacterium]MDE3173404.1 hypothetical protein [Gemmatimonadota bacterium]MDE3215202.1 hypothetical protein [Gemmatimonadota bacterium]